VLDVLVLTRVSISVKQEVDVLLLALVLVNETVSVVGTSCGIWRWVLALVLGNLSREVLVELSHGVFLVSHVNDSKSGGSNESVPVCCSSSPLEVVFQEGVIGSVGIHDSVSPESSTVEDRASWSNLFFNLLDNHIVSVVVFLQKLKVKSLSDFSRQDILEFT